MQITELRLSTAALAAQRAFYADTLGLPLLAETADSFTLDVGLTRLVVEATPEGKPCYHFAFNIPENLLDKAADWLAPRATPFAPDGRERVHFANWDADAIYFHDPAGNIVELIARHTLPNGAPAPFGAGDFLSISEIGLPTDDVPALVAALTGDLGVPPYREGDDMFAPLGDEQGLFIVVSTERPWFLTKQCAAIHPLAVTLRGDESRRLELPGLPYAIAVATG